MLTGSFPHLCPVTPAVCDDLGFAKRSREREDAYAAEVDALYASRYNDPDFDDLVSGPIDAWERDPLTASCEDHAGRFTCNEPDDLPF